MTHIVKSTGVREEFDEEKIRGSLRRANVPGALADRVANAVSERVKDGMPTKKIADIVHDQLKRENRALLYRYTLREALLKLGPAGFKFERYVASVLQAYGYETELPDEFRGKCVMHEVDVVAKKDGRTIMIEAKFRNDFDYFVKLKDTMATWARFGDLREGAEAGLCPSFDEPWIVTNGKLSSRSQAFGACRGIRLLGWNYPRRESLASFVDHTSLYPITALHDLKPHELDRFSQKGLMLCREVSDEDPGRLAKEVGLSKRRAGDIVDLCRQIITPEEGHGIEHRLG